MNYIQLKLNLINLIIKYLKILEFDIHYLIKIKKIFFLFNYFGSILLKNQYDLFSNFYIHTLGSYTFVREITLKL